MKNNHWSVRLATLDLPTNPMPGTVGAIFSCIAVWACCFFLQTFNFGIVFPLSSFLVAWPVINVALKYFKEPDPSSICLDEIVGMLFTLCFLSISWKIIALGFLIFRFFDITKPFGIKKIEQLPGAWGVLLDDVLAGIYANLVLNLILWFG